ncbi:hypothetical protein A9Q99_25630 [Gammaproteobacteria bacterium 45_16_T64]|nr:hypothetical protein A9Q99_25630 [Gammaproteobacteria bacterium 45_16_T64]
MAKSHQPKKQRSARDAGPPESLINALVVIFRPLVKLFIRHQINHTYISQLLKSIYVNVAEQEFQVDGTEQTDSRISMLTGIHRREVKRLRVPLDASLVMPENLSVGTQMLTTWVTDPRFLDEGTPKILPKSSKGEDVGFDTLVNSVSKQDLRVKVVLEDWLHHGLVNFNDEGFLVLQSEAFVTETGFDEKAFFFGKNLHDHISAGSHNLAGGKPPQFDRSVFYNKLTTESIGIIEKLIEDKGMETLKVVNKKANELQKLDRGDKDATHRINFGSYFWVESKRRGEHNG